MMFTFSRGIFCMSAGITHHVDILVPEVVFGERCGIVSIKVGRNVRVDVREVELREWK